jgi:hypothetical protein
MNIQFILLLAYIINSLTLIKCESITVSNIEINWTNLGNQTNFQISSSLSNGILPLNAWLAFGFNSQMVTLMFDIKNKIFIINLIN